MFSSIWFLLFTFIPIFTISFDIISFPFIPFYFSLIPLQSHSFHPISISFSYHFVFLIRFSCTDPLCHQTVAVAVIIWRKKKCFFFFVLFKTLSKYVFILQLSLLFCFHLPSLMPPFHVTLTFQQLSYYEISAKRILILFFYKIYDF